MLNNHKGVKGVISVETKFQFVVKLKESDGQLSKSKMIVVRIDNVHLSRGDAILFKGIEFEIENILYDYDSSVITYYCEDLVCWADDEGGDELMRRLDECLE